MLRSPKAQSDSPSRSESDLINLEREISNNLRKPEDLFRPVTQRAKRPRDSTDSSPPCNFSDIKEMITHMMSSQSDRLDKLENHILAIKGQTTNIESTNSDIEKSIKLMSDKMSTIEIQIKNLEQERKTMATELSSIRGKIESFDRHITKTSIEVRNVPKQLNETKDQLFASILHLSKQLGLELSSNDIRDVARSPSKREQKTSTITVEFANTLIMTQYLSAAKDYNKKNKENKLNSFHLGFSEPKLPIYLAELLTPASKKLFYLTRNFIKQSHFNYCWTSQGKIFVKETNDSAYFQIKDEAQLQSLSKPCIM